MAIVAETKDLFLLYILVVIVGRSNRLHIDVGIHSRYDKHDAGVLVVRDSQTGRMTRQRPQKNK